MKLIENLPERQLKIIALSAIAVFVFALYGPSLQNGFVHDDEGQIVQNPYIQSIKYLPKAFTSCIWEAYADGCEGRTNYYRPLHSISYIFTYAINASPAFFHFVNIIYYILLGLGVFLFSSKFITRIGALIATAVFLAHPIHPEAVLWIASVPELLYSIFVVFAFWTYLSDFKYKEWWVGGAFFLGLLAKEPAVLIPVVLMMHNFIWKFGTATIYSPEGESRGIKGGLLKRFLPTALFFGVYFILRTMAIGGIGERPDFYDFSLRERIYTSIFAFGEYIKRTIWPMELNPFIPFEPISSAANIGFLFNLVLVVLFLGMFTLALWRKEKVLVLGMSIFFLFLAPVVIFVNSVAENAIAERYLLLPSLGAALIVGYYLSLLFQKKNEILKWTAIAGLTAFIGFSIPNVYAQNDVWKTSKSLYEYSYELNQRKADTIDVTSAYDLAIIYESEGKFPEAKQLYEKVIASGEKKRKIPSIPKAYNNLGKIHLAEKDYDKAISLFEETLKFNEKHVGAYSNMAVAYAHKEEYVRAAESFIQALRIDAEFEGAVKNIRVLFSKIGTFSSYNTDGSYGELYQFVSELLKSPVWVDWQSNAEILQIISSARTSKGVWEVKIKIDPSYKMSLFPLIFYSIDEELYFRPKLSGSFNQEKGELTLTIPPQKQKTVKAGKLELYIILEDFKYAKFEL